MVEPTVLQDRQVALATAQVSLAGDDRLDSDDDRSEALADRAALVVKARWLLLLIMTLYGGAAAAIYAWGGMRELLLQHMWEPIAALGAAVFYNAALHFGISRRLPLHSLVQAQLVADLVLISTVVHFSGGAVSWFWVAYLLVTLEAAVVLDRRRDAWLVVVLAALMHGAVLSANYNAVLPAVAMPLVGVSKQGPLAQTLLVWSWTLASNVAVAVIGGLLMDRLRHRERDLAVAAVTDPQTGLHNRMYFDRRLANEFQRCQANGRQLALLRMDLEPFKAYCDQVGYTAGERLLGQFAGILRTSARKVGQTASGQEFDALCHLGGAEFAVILPELAGDQAEPAGSRSQHENAALQLAERIQSRAERFLADHGGLVIRFGVASLGERADSPQAMVRRAHKAITLAKEDADAVVPTFG
ncbi:MAG: GGDEF domain-containing protein [Deltaproteobacteria bacterium]|nr:GGDEF domain-containing protein [Deltaproteobacteria bacterium]